MDLRTTGTLDWPIDEVWAMLADFSGLAVWHPLIEACEADGSEVGALRTVRFSDRSVVERLDVLDDAGHTLVYRVVESTRPASVGLSARITLTEKDSARTLVEWIAGLPPGAEDLAANLATYYPLRIQHLREALAARS